MAIQEKELFDTYRRYFRLDRRDLAYLTFIVEACEGLATLTTLENKETLVRLTTLSCFAAEMDSLIEALRGEITMTETAPPLTGCAAGGDHHA